eukprot:3933828-Rhodomonas_salina.3
MSGSDLIELVDARGKIAVGVEVVREKRQQPAHAFSSQTLANRAEMSIGGKQIRQQQQRLMTWTGHITLAFVCCFDPGCSL